MLTWGLHGKLLSSGNLTNVESGLSLSTHHYCQHCPPQLQQQAIPHSTSMSQRDHRHQPRTYYIYTTINCPGDHHHLHCHLSLGLLRRRHRTRGDNLKRRSGIVKEIITSSSAADGNDTSWPHGINERRQWHYTSLDDSVLVLRVTKILRSLCQSQFLPMLQATTKTSTSHTNFKWFFHP